MFSEQKEILQASIKSIDRRCLHFVLRGTSF